MREMHRNAPSRVLDFPQPESGRAMSRIVRRLLVPCLFASLAACVQTSPPHSAMLASAGDPVVPAAAATTPSGASAAAAKPAPAAAAPVSVIDLPPPADWPVDADL